MKLYLLAAFALAIVWWNVAGGTFGMFGPDPDFSDRETQEALADLRKEVGEGDKPVSREQFNRLNELTSTALSKMSHQQLYHHRHLGYTSAHLGITIFTTSFLFCGLVLALYNRIYLKIPFSAALSHGFVTETNAVEAAAAGQLEVTRQTLRLFYFHVVQAAGLLDHLINRTKPANDSLPVAVRSYLLAVVKQCSIACLTPEDPYESEITGLKKMMEEAAAAELRVKALAGEETRLKVEIETVRGKIETLKRDEVRLTQLRDDSLAAERRSREASERLDLQQRRVATERTQLERTRTELTTLRQELRELMNQLSAWEQTHDVLPAQLVSGDATRYPRLHPVVRALQRRV